MLHPLNKDVFSPHFSTCLYWLAEDVELTVEKNWPTRFISRNVFFFFPVWTFIKTLLKVVIWQVRPKLNSHPNPTQWKPTVWKATSSPVWCNEKTTSRQVTQNKSEAGGQEGRGEGRSQVWGRQGQGPGSQSPPEHVPAHGVQEGGGRKLATRHCWPQPGHSQ